MFGFFRKKNETKSNPAGFINLTNYSFFDGKITRDYNGYAEEGYQSNVIAYACINKIATSVASISLSAYTTENGLMKKLDLNHALNKILTRPNPSQGGADLFCALVSYKLIAGSSYLLPYPMNEGKGPPTELWGIRPDHVTIKPGAAGYPAYYEIGRPGTVKKIIPVDQFTGKADIFRTKNFNPLDYFKGLSPFQPTAFSVDTFSSILKWNKRLLDRGARPSGAFTMKDDVNNKLSDEQYARLNEQINQQYSGGDNAGKPLLLEGGLSFVEMQLNPKDMDYLNSKHSTARDICLGFGVPPQVIGLPDAQTFSNYSEARLAFWEETIIPITDSIVDDLNIWLAPMYGENVFIGYDKNSLDALAPKRQAQFKMYNEARFLTPNEKREALGYEAIDGGDELDKQAPVNPAASEAAAAKKEYSELWDKLTRG